MAFVYKPPHSQTYRIGYYDAGTQTAKSISAKTKDKSEAKKICKNFTARHRLNIDNKKPLRVEGGTLKLSEAFKIFLRLHSTAVVSKTHIKWAFFLSSLVKSGVSVQGSAHVNSFVIPT